MDKILQDLGETFFKPASKQTPPKESASTSPAHQDPVHPVNPVKKTRRNGSGWRADQRNTSSSYVGVTIRRTPGLQSDGRSRCNWPHQRISLRQFGAPRSCPSCKSCQKNADRTSWIAQAREKRSATCRRHTPASKLDLRMKSQTPELAPLAEVARQLQEVHAQAKALGIFTADRELLECPKCGTIISHQKDPGEEEWAG